MQPDLILIPFGKNATPGTIDPIPKTRGPDDDPQQATWDEGFPQVTMTPLAAGGIPPKGQDFNGVLKAISEHTVFSEHGGQFKWSSAYVAESGGYSIGDVVQADDGLNSYVSLVNTNTANFNTNPASIGTSWGLYAGRNTQTQATEAVAGIAEIATQSEVTTGADDARIVTPAKLRGAQATQAEAEAGTDNTKLMTPLRVRQQTVGRYLNTQVFTANGTYTPTPGTNKIRVRGCGGGSSGFGVPAGGPGVISGGSGGGAGSFAEAIYTTGFSGLSVTIGAGGVGAINSQTLGGTTAFGGLLSCPGGGGGGILQIATSGVVVPTQQGVGGTIPTGSGIIFASEGACGQSTLLFGTINDGLAGMGGATPFGGGSPNGSGAGGPGRGYGSGGSGTISRNGEPARVGGNGKSGILIIEEYA